jgi:ribonuclease HI
MSLTREEWGKQEMPLLRNGEIWYTDGSKMGGGAGAGLWCSQEGACESISLGEYATVFQAEVAAILTSAMIALEAETKGRRIKICSDSQAAIAALVAHNFNSRLVWDCKCALDRLGENNDVVLVWVPGHSGIKGNETADLLAKAGSTSCMIGPEPALGIPYCLGQGRIREWLQRKHREF